jgi:hypothetical protein
MIRFIKNRTCLIVYKFLNFFDPPHKKDKSKDIYSYIEGLEKKYALREINFRLCYYPKYDLQAIHHYLYSAKGKEKKVLDAMKKVAIQRIMSSEMKKQF